MAIIRATSLVASCKGGVINGAALSLDTSRLLFVLFDRVGRAQVLVWSLFTTKFKHRYLFPLCKELSREASDLVVGHIAHRVARRGTGDNAFVHQALCSKRQSGLNLKKSKDMLTPGSVSEFEYGKRTTSNVEVRVRLRGPL